MTKLLAIAVICVYCIQQSYEIDDGEIRAIRTGLERMPAMEMDEIEKIMNYLEVHRKNPNTLLSFAMQGDTCTNNPIDLKHIVAVALNVIENDEHIQADETLNIKHFTDNQLELVEAELKKSQTPETVHRSVNILRIIRNGMLNHEKFGPNAVDLYKSAAKALSKGCPSEDP